MSSHRTKRIMRGRVSDVRMNHIEMQQLMHLRNVVTLLILNTPAGRARGRKSHKKETVGGEACCDENSCGFVFGL